MKYIILLLMLLIGCSSVPKKEIEPKYKIGDCVNMFAMSITPEGEWDSTGYELGEFKIVDIILTNKMNVYMASRMHGNRFYKVKMLDISKKYPKQDPNSTYVIAIEDLDRFRYAGVFWPLPEYNNFKCNDYSEKK